MKTYTTQQAVEIVLEELKKNSYLTRSFKDPVFKIVYSNVKKRFSDFYRIRVYEKNNSQKCEYLWVKALKNKPKPDIDATLSRQYDLMTDFFYGLKKMSCHHDQVKLSCCMPVGLFLDQSAIVTKECKGLYFDKYLKQHIPVFSSKSILRHCENLGRLLKAFHEHFKDSVYVKNTDINTSLEHYRHKYHHPPDSSLQYLTICHHDYSPRNLFVSDECVELIDFVALEPGFPQEDLLFFSGYILKAKFNYMYTHNFKISMVKSFLKGYEIAGS